MCRHHLPDGRQCSRRRAIGSRYCWQHAQDARWDDIRSGNIPQYTRPLVSPTSPPVQPDFIARLLAATAVDSAAKRQFAQEFCEAYQAVDGTFHVAGFMHTALEVPSVERP